MFTRAHCNSGGQSGDFSNDNTRPSIALLRCYFRRTSDRRIGMASIMPQISTSPTTLFSRSLVPPSNPTSTVLAAAASDNVTSSRRSLSSNPGGPERSAVTGNLSASIPATADCVSYQSRRQTASERTAASSSRRLASSSCGPLTRSLRAPPGLKTVLPLPLPVRVPLPLLLLVLRCSVLTVADLRR